MFVLVTLSSYGTVISGTASAHLLGDAAAGLAMGAPALVWSGLRADRQARSYAWLGPAQAGASAALYTASHVTAWHFAVFSLLYLLSAIMAGMSVLELLRRPERGGGRLLPLTVASTILLLIGIASVIAVTLTWASPRDTPVLPDLKAIGQIAYLTCALVTLLSLARLPGALGSTEYQDSFRRVAADRLSRAREAGETGWSLLALSLDDTETLRIAGGESAFRRILDRFASDVHASFPVEADIGADGPTGFVVLLSRPDGVVRDCIRDLLDRVSTVTDSQPLSVEFSASVGWAKVQSNGYDLAVLSDAARDAMAKARAAGGHRFERAESVV
jgi:predicted signal transduction protein with EAL and GGDEF domain